MRSVSAGMLEEASRRSIENVVSRSGYTPAGRSVSSWTSACETSLPKEAPSHRNVDPVAGTHLACNNVAKGTARMKFAIIADIHANLEALQAVFGDAKQCECTHHAFLGD